jgi:hypothetical protein
MKNLKLNLLIITILMAGSYQLNAQSKRDDRRLGKHVSRASVIYKTPKHKVITRRTLSDRRVIQFKSDRYYYDRHKFYTFSGGRYIPIIPRIGFKIDLLPLEYITIRNGNMEYYWCDGIFYNRIDDGYEVVKPELGTVVYELPDDVEKVEINGFVYYEFDDILYEKIQIDGTRAYEVVGFVE